MGELGRIAIIANPAAQNGTAATVAEKISAKLCQHVGESACKIHLTQRAKHAIDIVAEVGGSCDTLVVIGGDGIVHEAVNGLMMLPDDARPNLAVVPVGSGNDYALTLGMSSDPHKALEQILECDVRRFDVGLVNGEFFAETLSFGIDAAIAIDTMERRKRSGRRGTLLYMESGIDQLLNHLHPQSYRMTLSGVPGVGNLKVDGESYIFAVQIGRTYGGHFDVCPDANPEDGLFDICLTRKIMGPARAVAVFIAARFGLHKNMKAFKFYKASSLVVDFTEPPAAQADGEIITGSHFEIDTVPHALGVIVGDYKA